MKTRTIEELKQMASEFAIDHGYELDEIYTNEKQEQLKWEIGQKFYKWLIDLDKADE